MDSFEVLRQLQQLTERDKDALEMKIDVLAIVLHMDRRELVSYIVDLVIGGYIDYNSEVITLTEKGVNYKAD